MELRTLFIQEMLKYKILMPWISIAYRHSDKELNRTLMAQTSHYRYSKSFKRKH